MTGVREQDPNGICYSCMMGWKLHGKENSSTTAVVAVTWVWAHCPTWAQARLGLGPLMSHWVGMRVLIFQIVFGLGRPQILF